MSLDSIDEMVDFCLSQDGMGRLPVKKDENACLFSGEYGQMPCPFYDGAIEYKMPDLTSYGGCTYKGEK